MHITVMAGNAGIEMSLLLPAPAVMIIVKNKWRASKLFMGLDVTNNSEFPRIGRNMSQLWKLCQLVNFR